MALQQLLDAVIANQMDLRRANLKRVEFDSLRNRDKISTEVK